MAHSLSAQKRVRQNLKRKLRNRRRTVTLRTAIKSFAALLTAGKIDDATAALPKLYSTIDSIAGKGTLHKNTASRYKARLTARLNKAKAPAAK